MDLIKAAKKGDKNAFTTLIDAQRKMLYNSALLIVKNEDDALDAIQDTILTVWAKLPTLKEDKFFKTWLVKILYNKCYDILKTKHYYDELENVPETGAETDYDTVIDIKGAMEKLNADDRLILSLFYYDDFSIKQISSVLAIGEGAVRSRLNRGRNRFKDQYLLGKESCLNEK